MVILMVAGEDLEWINNRTKKLFSPMRNGGLVVDSGIIESLSELFHMEEHCFGFIVKKKNKEVNGLHDIVDDSFECFSGINQSIGSDRGCIVSGDNIREINSGSWVWNQRVQDSGPGTREEIV